jgi:hypothetical protein
MCTPRSDEEKAAAREHWAQFHAERQKDRNARARADALPEGEAVAGGAGADPGRV